MAETRGAPPPPAPASAVRWSPAAEKIRRHLLDESVTYQKAPRLFCLDLYNDFDLDRLAASAEPTSVFALRNLKLTPELKGETGTAK